MGRQRPAGRLLSVRVGEYADPMEAIEVKRKLNERINELGFPGFAVIAERGRRLYEVEVCYCTSQWLGFSEEGLAEVLSLAKELDARARSKPPP